MSGHTVWTEAVDEGGFAVMCIPHGYLGWALQGLTAFCVALAHDIEMGGGSLG